MEHRACSVFEIKSIDEDARIVEGIASTPSTDRMGDIVEPMGAKFRKHKDGSPDVPIKWQHGKDPRVGDVGVGYMLSASPSKDGIPVRLQFAKTNEPGMLKEVLDFVWHSVKLKLVRGLSIGFSPIGDPEPIKGTFGLRFKEWEFLELSAVTIPANADASIHTIKSIDAQLLAASGKQPFVKSMPMFAVGDRVVALVEHMEGMKGMAGAIAEVHEGMPPYYAVNFDKPMGEGNPHKWLNEDEIEAESGQMTTMAASGRSTPPGASGSVKLIPKQTARGATMNINEQISAFENTRAAKAARRNEIQEKAAKEGRSKDEAERQEFDTITDELKSIDRELVDLRALEAENVSSAKAVNATSTETASASRGSGVTVKPEEKLEKGIEFARYAMCVAAAKGDIPLALNLAKTHYPQQGRAINILKAASERGSTVERLLVQQKAAVAAGTTTETTWAAPLLAYNTFAGDFVEFLRPQTILGKFGQGNVPSLRRIPFNVHIKGQTSGGTGYWVGEGKPKPVTKFDFNDTYHGYTKVAAISVLTEELIRFSDPSAERLVRDALASVLIERIDTDFIDPAKAASSGVSPASITNGVTAIAASGATADDVRNDLQDLWAAGITANLPLTSAVYITTPSIALALSLMLNALAQPSFPDMTMNGGTLLGVPVIVSNYVPAGTFVLAYASEIYLSDDNAVTVDASREASLQMLDNPTNDSDTPTPTTLVSMYQTDSVALRAHRFINWSKRRTTAVALVEDVAWGGASPS